MRYLVGTGSNPPFRQLPQLGISKHLVLMMAAWPSAKRLAPDIFFHSPSTRAVWQQHMVGSSGDQTTARIVQELWSTLSRLILWSILSTGIYWLWWPYLDAKTSAIGQTGTADSPLPRPLSAPKRSCSLRWRREKPRKRSWDTPMECQVINFK